MPWLQLALLPVLVFAPPPARAERLRYRFSGHAKPRFIVTSYPEDSFFRPLAGWTVADLNFAGRLSFGVDAGRWDLQTDYQLLARYGDTIRFTRDLPPELEAITFRLQTDERRLFDLTKVLVDKDDFAAVQRLDRLAVGHTTRRTVVRFGRQAITWGNGLFYTPMDIFNPFDPATVDKEFKSGDDMLYAQFLRRSGHDVQGVMVFRRDPINGDVEADQSSLAIKYHGLAGASEFDALVARHFGQTLLGAGGNRSIGGAVWRGDVMVAFTDDHPVATLVTSLGHSWTWSGKNVNGSVEYFFNGFGQRHADYAPASLIENPNLLRRIARGELFTLGRHYLALSTTIEVTPLVVFTPNVFANLTDPSALLQIVAQNDLAENFVLLGALSVPVGTHGTEFGGSETGVPGVYLSNGPGLFLQLAWYF